MTDENLNSTNKFILPPSGDAGVDEARRQLVEDLQKISPDDIKSLSEAMAKANENGTNLLNNLEWMIKQLPIEDQKKLLKIMSNEGEVGKKYGEPNPELVGHYDKVVSDIENNYIHYGSKDEEELFGLRGWRKSLELPAVGNFEGFKMETFHAGRTYLGNDSDYDSMLYSMDDIGYILQKINEYLNEYGVGDDVVSATKYSDMLKSWKNKNGRDYVRCSPARILTKVLYCPTWLKDTLPNNRRIYLGSWAGEKIGFDYDIQEYGHDNILTIKL